MSLSMTRKEKAMQNFYDGYNCAQSLVLAFEDLLDMDRDILLSLVSPFGGGMGRLREVCGSVSGMFFVLGRLCGYNDPTDKSGKSELYAHVQELANRFEEKNKSIICQELLGLSEKRQDPTPEERTPEYYKKRPCPEIIGSAAEILERYIREKDLLR